MDLTGREAGLPGVFSLAETGRMGEESADAARAVW